jgi:SecD/SecF fusion protein
MTERRSHLFLLGLVVVVLLAVAAIAVPGSPVQREPTLGLDLQGGIEVVLEAQPQRRGEELSEADLDRSVEIIRNRIDKLGVSEPEVRKQGENQIGVQLAGVFNRARAVEIIGKTAQLQLYDLQDNLITVVSRDLRGFPTPKTGLHGLLTAAKPQAKKGTPSNYYLFNAKKKRVAGPKGTRAELLQTRYVKRNFQAGKVPKKHTVLAAPERTRILRCGIEQRYCPGVNEEQPSRTYYYLFRFDPDNDENPVPEMTGNDLNLTGTQQDFDTRSSEPIVTMQFTDSGGDKFADITRELAER